MHICYLWTNTSLCDLGGRINALWFLLGRPWIKLLTKSTRCLSPRDRIVLVRCQLTFRVATISSSIIFTKCWPSVGPSSTTLAQHWANIGVNVLCLLGCQWVQDLKRKKPITNQEVEQRIILCGEMRSLSWCATCRKIHVIDTSFQSTVAVFFSNHEALAQRLATSANQGIHWASTKPMRMSDVSQLLTSLSFGSFVSREWVLSVFTTHIAFCEHVFCLWRYPQWYLCQ